MRHYYCSTFSKDYAYKGLLLYNSLLRWDKDFRMFLVCHDDEVRDLYQRMNLENAILISLAEVEEHDPELKRVKASRNVKEYIWTAKGSVMLYILNNYPETDHIVWLDGDTCFYADPSPIYSEWGNYSIMLTEERWRKPKRHQIYSIGRYNTGFMGFKRDKNALGCLQWFRARLIEWCFDKREKGLWSDQLYVNDWLTRFKNVGVIKNLGVNVGPYIIGGCQVSKHKDAIYVNGEKLIFYHSYGFRYHDGNEFDVCSYMLSIADDVLEWIYLPYMYDCNEIVREISKVRPDFYSQSPPRSKYIRNYFNLSLHEQKTDVLNFCTILSSQYAVQGLALYQSLQKHNKNFKLWILCMDKEVYNLLAHLNLENTALISVENIMNERLVVLQHQRKLHEFCWTLKPYLLWYLLRNNFTLDSLIYLDADLFFYQDPQLLFQDWGESPGYITKLWMGEKWANRVGKFSAGIVGIKRNQEGMRVLNTWRKQCRDWCYDKFEPGRWADQKYLDGWPELAPNLKVSNNKGINTGPWNIRHRGYPVQQKDEAIYFAGDKLVCYHFSGFRILAPNEFDLCNRKPLPEKASPIYEAYVQQIAEVIKRIESVAPGFLAKTTANTEKVYNRVIVQGEGGSRYV